MKGLLHSKKFKKNLQKWLFMYAGVMALLTTVITYSKYISNFQGEDQARVSKFDFKIEQTTCPEVPGICKASYDNGDGSLPVDCRPTQEIASCFKVNTSKLEVSSELMLTFDPALNTTFGDGYYNSLDESNPAKLFDIVRIESIKNNVRSQIYPVDESSDSWTPDTTASNRLMLKRNINVSNNEAGEWTFMVVMKRTKDSNNKIYSTAESNLKLVKVSYSMTQID